jgi:hypothetical protein
LDADITRLTSKGVILSRGPFGESGGPKIAFLDDPDDVVIELIQP